MISPDRYSLLAALHVGTSIGNSFHIPVAASSLQSSTPTTIRVMLWSRLPSMLPADEVGGRSGGAPARAQRGVRWCDVRDDQDSDLCPWTGRRVIKFWEYFESAKQEEVVQDPKGVLVFLDPDITVGDIE